MLPRVGARKLVLRGDQTYTLELRGSLVTDGRSAPLVSTHTGRWSLRARAP